VEAALAGCALVLGDIPSLREVWADAALFVPPDDHQSLADTLERVIRSNALREDLSRRAQLRARRYSPERMALGYIEAYKIASGAAARRQAA
jgi:glycogen(starch) synthase